MCLIQDLLSANFDAPMTKLQICWEFLGLSEWKYNCSKLFIFRILVRTSRLTGKLCRTWTERARTSSTSAASRTRCTSRTCSSVLNSGGRSWCDVPTRKDDCCNRPTKKTNGFVFLCCILCRLAMDRGKLWNSVAEKCPQVLSAKFVIAVLRRVERVVRLDGREREEDEEVYQHPDQGQKRHGWTQGQSQTQLLFFLSLRRDGKKEIW